MKIQDDMEIKISLERDNEYEHQVWVKTHLSSCEVQNMANGFKSPKTKLFERFTDNFEKFGQISLQDEKFHFAFTISVNYAVKFTTLNLK